MCRDLIKIRSCAILSDLTSLKRFLVTLRPINVFVFNWLIRKYETFSLVNSSCLRNNLNLACDFKSLSRNVRNYAHFYCFPPPPSHFHCFLPSPTPPPSSFLLYFYQTSYLECQTGQKGQTQVKSDEKDLQAKFHDTFLSLYPSMVSPGLLLSK